MENTFSGVSPVSTGEMIAYTIISIPVVFFGILINVWYLFWQIRDRNWICSFNVILVHISICNLLLSFMPLLNIIILYHQDVPICVAFRVIISCIELEESALLLLVSADRLFFLYKGAIRYRQKVTIRCTSLALLSSWLLVGVLNGFLLYFEEELDSDLQGGRCKPPPSEAVAGLPVALDVLMLCLCLLLIKSCKHTGISKASNSYISQTLPHQTGCVRLKLHARGDAALGLTASDHYVPYEAVRSSLSDDHRASPSATAKAQEGHNVQETNPKEPGAYGGSIRAQTLEAHKQSLEPTVAGARRESNKEEDKKAGFSAKKSGEQASNTLDPQKDFLLNSPPRMSSFGLPSYSANDTGNKYAGGNGSCQSDGGLGHPKIKSTLPAVLRHTTSVHLRRMEAMAAQQLAVLLTVHFLLASPVYITRLVVAFDREDRSAVLSAIFWLDLLFALQSCLYPAIFCNYSDRLRDRLRLLGCAWCPWQRHNKVRMSSLTMPFRHN